MLKARRYGYLPTDFLSLDDLLDSSDESLFRSIRYHPNTLVIISVPVDTASPFPLSLQSSCAKTLLTACYSMMIYINVIQTGLCFVCLLFYFAILHV